LNKCGKEQALLAMVYQVAQVYYEQEWEVAHEGAFGYRRE